MSYKLNTNNHVVFVLNQSLHLMVAGGMVTGLVLKRVKYNEKSLTLTFTGGHHVLNY